MIKIGLTGGIGTGKSVVTEMLAEKGAVIINADKVGHEAYEPGTESYKDVVAAFGKEIMDENGGIDRKKLGPIVFGSAEALQKLNQILHPRMYDMMDKKLAVLRQQGAEVVVIEAAILIEAKWTPLVDKVWVVTAPEETVIQRLIARNGLTREQALARIQSQMSQAERAMHSDVVIDNSGDLEKVRQKVDELWHQIKNEVRA